MGTPSQATLFRSVSILALLSGLVSLGAGCRAARVPGPGARPWPQNAVDREIRRLSEQAVAETRVVPGAAASARKRTLLERLERLPAEESPGYRLDRALLEGHLRHELGEPEETRGSTRTLARDVLPASERDRARALLAALVQVGVAEAAGLEPTQSATRAVSAAFLALAAHVRPGMPLSPARQAFETPGFRLAWARLGPRILWDLGATAPPLDRSVDPGDGIAAAYEHIRRVQGPRFRAWDTARLLLGLGSEDGALLMVALEDMGVVAGEGWARDQGSTE